MYSGMTGGFMTSEGIAEFDKLHKQRLRDAGFLAPLVPEMRRYMDQYRRTQVRHAGRMHLSVAGAGPDGNPMTLAEIRLWSLRNKIREAISTLSKGVKLA